MTRTEALAVTRVALSSDSGCPSCVRAALRDLARELPAVDWFGLACEIDPDIDPVALEKE